MKNAVTYLGKDGTLYYDWQEKKKADAKWEQQERQNKLLEEQNNLIKQQDEERKRTKNEQREEQREEQKQQRQQKRDEQLQQTINNFIQQCQDTLYPLMEEAGIKNPLEYHKKLRELYGSKPETLELIDKESTEIIKEEKYPNEMSFMIKKINMLNSQLANPPKSKKEQIKSMSIIYLIFSIIIGVILGISTGELVFSVAFTGGLFVFELLLVPFMVKSSKQALERTKKTRIDTINSLNAEIEKINNSKGLQEWENKIKNFEKKRLEKFNYKLEIALCQLCIYETFIESQSVHNAGLSLDNAKIMNYELQFNPYPKDFKQKKEEFWKEKREKKAEENGTEIFENL